MSTIRMAQESDLESIRRLSFDLGYKPEFATVKAGFQQIQNHPDYELVVILENELVVGWMNLCIRHRIEDLPFLQIVAIVTSVEKRGQGYGKKLLRYAEDQAKKKNLNFVGLYSNKIRLETHNFYKSQGFNQTKESYFFTKQIN